MMPVWLGALLSWFVLALTSWLAVAAVLRTRRRVRQLGLRSYGSLRGVLTVALASSEVILWYFALIMVGAGLTDDDAGWPLALLAVPFLALALGLRLFRLRIRPHLRESTRSSP